MLSRFNPTRRDYWPRTQPFRQRGGVPAPHGVGHDGIAFTPKADRSRLTWNLVRMCTLPDASSILSSRPPGALHSALVATGPRGGGEVGKGRVRDPFHPTARMLSLRREAGSTSGRRRQLPVGKGFARTGEALSTDTPRLAKLNGETFQMPVGKKRREWDSNPRYRVGIPVFKTGAIVRSAIPPLVIHKPGIKHRAQFAVSLIV